MNRQSTLKFWINRLLVMLAVIASAFAILTYLPEPGTSNSASSSDSGKPRRTTVAENVSNFYAEFRASSTDPIERQYGEDVIVLESDDSSIEELVDQTSETDYPPIVNWEGDFKSRAFARGSTLKTDATEHAIDAGYALVWDLDQDFVVRHRFVSTNTLTGMLAEIAGAIDANFVNKVLVYYCGKKRTVVVTATSDDYLELNCRLYDPNNY